MTPRPSEPWMRPGDCDKLLQKQAKSYRVVITGLISLVAAIVGMKAFAG